MHFFPIKFDQTSLTQYSQLFLECFPGAGARFTPAYLEWLYVANPDGQALGFDAYEGDELAAHYVCVPARARVQGEEVSVLLSLNTATRPRYQGKGLFTKLAAMTYEAGSIGGYDGVYGVANANSTPGFTRKLGFQLVRPLDALVGVGRLGTALAGSTQSSSFERLWRPESLAWRCANPVSPVQSRTNGALTQLFAPALPLASAYAELAIVPPALPRGAPRSPVRLFLGLVPDALRGFGSYASIPARLRPSPLNLIYRSFTPRVTSLDPSAINFSFIDFDAY
ncbi:MAG: family N-acetyltransferase [Massilia sp.]|jgi:GNAT superfamily N-acetyltransferase|nr:family N-acetyltransferase [Massilia sp.]